MAKLSRLTSSSAVIKTIEECDRLGREAFLSRYGYGPARRYFLAFQNRLYDSKAIVGVAWGKQHGAPLLATDFSGGEKTVQATLERLGFHLTLSPLRAERERREAMWKHLRKRAPNQLASPATIAAVGIRPAQTGQGIYRDLSRTKHIDAHGVTLSLIDRGTAYVDEFDDTGGTYHYPSTNRGGRDESEVTATKAAYQFDIPLFVQLKEGNLYRVHLGWVVGYSDETATFLIEFSRPADKLLDPETSFAPFQARSKKTSKRTRKSRSGQRRFRFQVAARYQNRCAFCSIDQPEVLDAAHIIGVDADGSDDPRNGLLLCATHHRAFDASLLGIDPETLEIMQPDAAGKLGVERRRVLEPAPAKEALVWRWKQLRRTATWKRSKN